MLVKSVSFDDFTSAFADMDRDYFSLEAYRALYDYYEDTDETIELDVIAICCDWTEYDNAEFVTQFGYLYEFDQYLEDNDLVADDEDEPENNTDYLMALGEVLEDQTMLFSLDNSILVMAF